MEQSQRHTTGGIIACLVFIEEHGQALEYDLITKTRYTLDDIGRSLPWRALFSFITHLTHDSAVFREINPEQTRWADGTILAWQLADLYDLLSALRYEHAAANFKGSHKEPKPYPRPGAKPKTTTYGHDPIPISQFDEWWNS